MGLPFYGKYFAGVSRLGSNFFGILFIVATTPFPETVLSIAATRLENFDFAVRNIFGSTIFNFNILALKNILFTNEPIFF